MPHFIRNKLAEALMFRAGYTTIPADGAWHAVDTVDVEGKLFAPAIHLNQAELCEAESKPTDVKETNRPKMDIIAKEAVAQGLSLEEYLKHKADKAAGIVPEVPAAPAAPKKIVLNLKPTDLPDAMKASLGTGPTAGGLTPDEFKAMLEAKKAPAEPVADPVVEPVAEVNSESEVTEPVDAAEGSTETAPKVTKKKKQ